MVVMNFNDVLKKIDKEKSSILLGNGFSMGYDKNRFSFTNLLETAKKKEIIPKDSKILQVFEKIETSDFEKVIRYLDEAKSISNIYFNNKDLSELERDIDNLKKYLVDTIMNNHPENVLEFRENKNSQQCAEILQNFKRIYTLNYDLLLYWVIMENKLDKIFLDGFGETDDNNDYVKFLDFSYNKNNKKYFYYLHGALHFFDNKTDIIKLTFNRTGDYLKKQIQYYLSQNIYPVFISEGTYKDKLEKIRHSYYLNHCYKSFKSISGDLVIYGTNLKSNDEHILNAIIENKNLKRIYIGYNSNINTAQELQDKILNAENNEKQVFIYNSKTANFWS